MKQFNNPILDKQNYFLNNEREALIKQQQQKKDEKKRRRYDDIIVGFYGKAFDNGLLVRRQVLSLSYFQPIRI